MTRNAGSKMQVHAVRNLFRLRGLAFKAMFGREDGEERRDGLVEGFRLLA